MRLTSRYSSDSGEAGSFELCEDLPPLDQQTAQAVADNFAMLVRVNIRELVETAS
jgi:hypothetical protein